MKNIAAVNRRKMPASQIRRLVIERRVRMLRLGEMNRTFEGFFQALVAGNAARAVGGLEARRPAHGMLGASQEDHAPDKRGRSCRFLRIGSSTSGVASSEMCEPANIGAKNVCADEVGP
jgi:hypothetical protein